MKKLLMGIALCSVLLLACSKTLGALLEKEFNRTNQRIEIIVIVHDTERDLTNAYKAWMGKELKGDNEIRKGFSVWSRPGKDNLTCEIHVVDPKNRRDSDRMETWGHELVHCVYGRFHK